MNEIFRKFAEKTARSVGSPWAFVLVVLLSVVWLALGPVFGFSDTWQLTMNTVASQITFLIAFLLQNSQNRDTRALHLKLDELLRTAQGARSGLISLEALSDEDLARLEREFARLGRRSEDGGPPSPRDS